jgi:hypothetical protein
MARAEIGQRADVMLYALFTHRIDDLKYARILLCRKRIHYYTTEENNECLHGLGVGLHREDNTNGVCAGS